jgi:hypothetical protein
MSETPTAAPAAATPRALTVAEARTQQNFAFAAMAGVGAAIVGAVLWAIVTVVTEMELGLMAIAVGYIVGQAIKATGKGIDVQFGVLGAVCALLGCVLGNVISAVALYAKFEHLPLDSVFNLLSVDFLSRTTTAFFQPLDLLFYGIAIYEGYRFSFRYKPVKS